jgi:hypothetical protein
LIVKYAALNTYLRECFEILFGTYLKKLINKKIPCGKGRKNNGVSVGFVQRSVKITYGGNLRICILGCVGSQLRWQLSHSHAQLCLSAREFLIFLCMAQAGLKHALCPFICIKAKKRKFSEAKVRAQNCVSYTYLQFINPKNSLS